MENKQQEWENFMHGQKYNFLSVIQPRKSDTAGYTMMREKS